MHCADWLGSARRLRLATPLLTRRVRHVVGYAARLAAAEAARAASDRHVVRAFVAELRSSWRRLAGPLLLAGRLGLGLAVGRPAAKT